MLKFNFFFVGNSINLWNSALRVSCPAVLLYFSLSFYSFIFLVGVFQLLIVSNSLWLHGLQHARLPCPSLSLGFCLNSCPLSWWLSWWCCLTSATLFFCLQSSPAAVFSNESALCIRWPKCYFSTLIYFLDLDTHLCIFLIFMHVDSSVVETKVYS